MTASAAISSSDISSDATGSREACPDVTIIGAGVIGLCCAAALARDGWSVTLVDRDRPGTGTSWGNAGGIAVSEVAPLGLPGTVLKIPGWLFDPLGPLALRWTALPRLAPWLLRFARNCRRPTVDRLADGRAALLRRAWDDWQPLLRAAGAEALAHRCGMLMVYASGRDKAADSGAVRLATDRGIPIEDVAPAAVRQLEPALAASVRHARFSPDWGHVDDPWRVNQAVERLARGAGVQVVRGLVTAIDSGADGAEALRLQDGRRLPVRRLVIAAGAWSHRLARQLGSRVPLETERGYHLHLPAPAVRLNRMITFVSHGFVATPMAGGIRLGGTVELAGLEAPPTWRRAHILARLAAAPLPGLVTDAAVPWMGYRPSLPDSLPVIGPSPYHRTVWYAFGHGHLGLTQAATTGRLIADLIAGRPPAVPLAPYRIDRAY